MPPFQLESCAWCDEEWQRSTMVELPDGWVCVPCWELVEMAMDESPLE